MSRYRSYKLRICGALYMVPKRKYFCLQLFEQPLKTGLKWAFYETLDVDGSPLVSCFRECYLSVIAKRLKEITQFIS